MAEEQRFEAQEIHQRLCANNCGFFGNPSTLNLCSKCYRDHRLKEDQASSAKIAVEKSLSVQFSSPVTLPVDEDLRTPIVLPASAAASPSSDLPSSSAVSAVPNRCTTCRKRVGLTGFKCRCGIMFCSTHRYPEQHGCTFDFKSVGREAIAKANPVVKGQKLERI